jgi:hypothetical protein
MAEEAVAFDAGQGELRPRSLASSGGTEPYPNSMKNNGKVI